MAARHPQRFPLLAAPAIDGGTLPHATPKRAETGFTAGRTAITAAGRRTAMGRSGEPVFNPDQIPSQGSAHGGRRARFGTAGLGNRAEPHTAGWPWWRVLLLRALLVGATVLLLLSGGGCTDAAKADAAANMSNLSSQLKAAGAQLSGSATTQPSPIVVGIDAAVPLAAPYLTAIGLVLGGVGVVVGAAANGLRTGSKVATATQTAAAAVQLASDHKVALAEVVGDIKQYRQPSVPWSQTTAKLVADVAGHTAAAVEPVTHISDLTITTDPATATTTATTTAQVPAG